MAEYIEREALLKELKQSREWHAETSRDFALLVRCENIVREQTAADVVEVVRCKDCKRSGMYAFGAGDKEELACLEIEDDGFVRFATAVDPNGFCNYGERKEGVE